MTGNVVGPTAIQAQIPRLSWNVLPGPPTVAWGTSAHQGVVFPVSPQVSAGW